MGTLPAAAAVTAASAKAATDFRHHHKNPGGLAPCRGFHMRSSGGLRPFFCPLRSPKTAPLPVTKEQLLFSARDCFGLLQRFRLRSDQRAFRSPFGNLRACNLLFHRCWVMQLLFSLIKLNNGNEIKHGVRRGQGGDRRLRLFYSPLEVAKIRRTLRSPLASAMKMVYNNTVQIPD